MNYDFTLDRKGMFSVLLSSVLMGALLFVAGLIVGSYWTANGPTASAASKKSTTDKDLNAPLEPARSAELPQSNIAAPDKPNATAGSEKMGPPALNAPQSAAVPPPVAGPQAAAAAPEQAADNKANDAAAAADAAKPNAKTEDSAAATPGVTASDLVTVEVGTFLDANAANHLFKSLERKGYAPTFFSGRDAQSREWYSIRIGAYSDKRQAENAAANFSKQEKVKAVVRPFGSL